MQRFITLSLGLFIILTCTFATADESSFMTLEEVQQYISETGGTWTAKENRITRMSPEQRARLTMPIDAEYLRKNARPFPAGAPKVDLPESFDWHNMDGKDYMSPVRDQESCGGCWTFAAVSAFEGAINIAMRDPNLDMDLAEQFIISCAGGGCATGGMPDEAIKIMSRDGIPDEACYPYEAIEGNCDDACDDWEDRVVKVRPKNEDGWGGYVMLYSDEDEINHVKELLLKGPVTATMIVFDDFYYYDNGVYSHPDCVASQHPDRGHVVTLVGWDDSLEAWIIKNSWNIDWGIEGYGYMKWGAGCIGYWVNYLEVDTDTLPGYTPPDGDVDEDIDTADPDPEPETVVDGDEPDETIDTAEEEVSTPEDADDSGCMSGIGSAGYLLIGLWVVARRRRKA